MVLFVVMVFCLCCVAGTTSPASRVETPWAFVSSLAEGERGVTPPPGSTSTPHIALTESPSSSVQPESGDFCDGDSDDGPEYLAIGNLGQRSRCNSRSSTHSSEQDQKKEPCTQRGSLAPNPPRRSSFSEGQKGPGRGAKGHTRSFSDTGISQKLRNGEWIGLLKHLKYLLFNHALQYIFNWEIFEEQKISRSSLALVRVLVGIRNANRGWFMWLSYMGFLHSLQNLITFFLHLDEKSLKL